MVPHTAWYRESKIPFPFCSLTTPLSQLIRYTSNSFDFDTFPFKHLTILLNFTVEEGTPCPPIPDPSSSYFSRPHRPPLFLFLTRYLFFTVPSFRPISLPSFFTSFSFDSLTLPFVTAYESDS